jgi:hypothetical protein
MNKKKNKTGRTFWDFLSEHPIISNIIGIIVSLFILLIVFGLILGYVSLNIKGLEIKKNKCKTDTVYINKIDSNKIDKSVIINKTSSVEKTISNNNKRILVKKGNSSVDVKNQPANINMGGTQVVGNNNGIIGDIGYLVVNSEDQRHLDINVQKRLIKLIEQGFSEMKQDKSACIEISAVSGNSEAYNFANEIVIYLRKNNYNTDDFIGQFQQSPPIKGVLVGYDIESKCLNIQVGMK